MMVLRLPAWENVYGPRRSESISSRDGNNFTNRRGNIFAWQIKNKTTRQEGKTFPANTKSGIFRAQSIRCRRRSLEASRAFVGNDFFRLQFISLLRPFLETENVGPSQEMPFAHDADFTFCSVYTRSLLSAKAIRSARANFPGGKIS